MKVTSSILLHFGMNTLLLCGQTVPLYSAAQFRISLDSDISLCSDPLFGIEDWPHYDSKSRAAAGTWWVPG